MGSLSRLAIQRLASVGAVSGGGGGAPPGDATIWPFVANWAAFSTVAGPLRDGDQVLVQSLGTGNSFGLAQYDEGDAEWKLLYGWFNSFADMTAFAEPIVTGGLAAVEVSASDDETAVRYQYESGWARTANNQPYVWTSTDVTAITNLDPSGIGVTRVGDLLAITTGGRTCMWRLHQFASGDTPDSTERKWWVDAMLPETGLVLSAYLIGDEVVSDDVELQAQGWDTVTRTAGTITQATGEVTLATTGTSASVAIRCEPTIAANTRVAVSGLMRATVGTGSGTQVSNVYAPWISDGGNFLLPARLSQANGGGTTGSIPWSGSAITLATASTREEFAFPTSTRGLVSLLNPGAQLSTYRVNNRLMCVAFRNTAFVLSDRVEFSAITGSTAAQNASVSLSHTAVILYGTT